MSLVIGLTGGIASGKSTVSNMFRELGIPVIDADLISREVVERGEKAYKDIVDTFGEGILQKNGSLDRKALGAIVFSDETKRKQLNSIVHPAVRERLISRRDALLEKGTRCVVLDIPLLFESGLADYADKTLVVYVDSATQLERLMERDQSSENDARQRINSQMALSQKLKLADAVIDNNGTKENTIKQLDALLRDWNVI